MTCGARFPQPLEPVPIRHGRFQAQWNISRDDALRHRVAVDARAAGPLLMLSMRSPCLVGSFSAQENTGQDFCGVLFNLQGRQRIGDASNHCLLEPGDILLWSSAASCDFEVTSAQSNLQILVPRARFERLIPNVLADRGWTLLPGRNPMPTLASTCVEALWQRRHDFGAGELEPALEASLELLGRSRRSPRGEHRSKVELFAQVQQYIERQLDDPDLDPGSIARRHGCSVRSLHALFAKRNVTVGGFIRQRRLELCRRALSGTPEVRISEVALSCGFNDAAHFSRLFRSAFGLSPRQYREARVVLPVGAGVDSDGRNFLAPESVAALDAAGTASTARMQVKTTETRQ